MIGHAAIVIRDEKKILFIKRSENKRTLPGIWAFPTGTRKPEETLEETAKREAQEELGIEMSVEKILGTLELPHFDVVLSFVLGHIEGSKELNIDPNEMSEAQWLTFQEFFDRYTNEAIGHGLVFLRDNPQIWQGIDE